MRKKLLVIIPAILALLCVGALAIYYTIEGSGGLISLFAAIDRTDMMRAERYMHEDGTALPYRIYVPEDYDPAQEYPLVLYLHGGGERGDCNRAQTRKNSVMQTLLNDANRAAFPCIVIAPQCPVREGWGDNLAALMGLLEQTGEDYAVDATRIYITGISMGGHGTWAMLAAYPDYFAAAVPICGWGDPETAPLLRNIPIWAFHGARDTVVRPEGSRGMVEALERLGGNIKYTQYPREGHQSWEKAYREAALFPWMFAQSKDQS